MLHYEIGIGNGFLKSIEKFADSEVQCLPASEVRLIDQTRRMKYDLEVATNDKEEWEQTSKPIYNALLQDQHFLDTQLKQEPTNESIAKELEEVRDKIIDLKSKLDQCNKKIKELTRLSSVPTTKNWRSSERQERKKRTR
jgi:hypothetical protein